MDPAIRPASKAGKWYSKDEKILSAQLEQWLAEVGDEIDGKSLPITGARVIIAPHAGYMFSGPTAAWAYKTLDLSHTKRIFLLGPSHVKRFEECAISSRSYYETPFGNLKVDKDTVKELKDTVTNLHDTVEKLPDTVKILQPEINFVPWEHWEEEEEHSLEMHLPYIHKIISKNFDPKKDSKERSKEDSKEDSKKEYPLLIPILVGYTSPEAEQAYGKIFAKYLADPTSIFIVSSDFCHWSAGKPFYYTYYLPKSASSPKDGKILKLRDKNPTDPPIYESIKRLDRFSMSAIEGGEHKAFRRNLDDTGNTVCGQHPIGVIMAALEFLAREDKIPGQEEKILGQEDKNLGQEDKILWQGKGHFTFIRYSQSQEIKQTTDSSVSYASAVAVL